MSYVNVDCLIDVAFNGDIQEITTTGRVDYDDLEKNMDGQELSEFFTYFDSNEQATAVLDNYSEFMEEVCDRACEDGIQTLVQYLVTTRMGDVAAAIKESGLQRELLDALEVEPTLKEVTLFGVDIRVVEEDLPKIITHKIKE